MNWRALIKAEFYAIFSNIPLLLTVFGGVFFYSFLYPLPYLNQVPHEQKVVVVNLDNSQLSRQLTRMVNATPQVDVVYNVSTINKAKELLLNNKVKGLLIIPKDFYKDILLKKSPALAFAGDAAYFLVYGAVVEGISRSVGTLSAQIKVSRMVVSGQNIALAASQYSAIKLNMKPLFNSTIGYVSYVVPAVFVLILHQTLLIAMGLLTGKQNEVTLSLINTSSKMLKDKLLKEEYLKSNNDEPDYYWLSYSVWQVMLVRAAFMLMIYIPLVAYYFGYSFMYYNVSRLASISDLILVIIPFLLSVIFLGMIIGLLIPRKELATLIVLLSSLPLVFVAGFIWPVASIPTIINTFAQFIPSTPAITIFLRLNQMGDSITQLQPLLLQLWLLTAIYALIAALLMYRKQMKVNLLAFTSIWQDRNVDQEKLRAKAWK